MKYLVTGTGRCGTVFVARFLTSVGIPCGHESIFDWRGYRWAEKRLAGEEPLELSLVSKAKYDGKEWKDIDGWINLNEMQAESSYMSAPFLNEELLQGVPVIHVVRNPIKVVNSFCNYIDYFKDGKGTNSYEQLIYRYLPELKKDMPQYDRACLYYIRWNQMIEKHKAFFHKIEDGPEPLLYFLGLSGDPFDDRNINTLRKPCNKRFTLDQIESEEIRDEFMEMGIQYGYNMSLNMIVI